ncbi:hypothetical protein [Streptomyces sp. MH13]|uniref:hypothetical protein n=1 Tax=Streptomyces sp. MH13 TaxID=3417651 RepID=UPI003CEAA50D
MRSHLAARPTRLVLAVTATVALAGSLTACDSDDDTAAAGQSSAQPSSPTTGGSGAPTKSSSGSPAATTGSTGSTGTAAGNSGGSGGSGGSNSSGGSGADDRPAWERGDICTTSDVDFSFTAGEGDYVVVTAKAQDGIACWLDHSAPLVVFNDSESAKPYPSELMKLTPPDAIELSGTTAAYATLIPNTTRAEDAMEADAADIAVAEGDSDGFSVVELPGTYSVSESAITDWYPSPDAATPQAN